MENTKENKKQYNQVTLDLTELGLFTGLYESIWLNDMQDFDEVMELSDMLGVDSCDIGVSIDYNKYLNEIGELYCEILGRELDEEGLFRVDSVYSPRWYNYETDTILITWDSDVLTIEEMNERLKELCDDNDNKNDWSYDMDMNAWDDRGHEIYSNLARYEYKGRDVWFGMDDEDVAEFKAMIDSDIV